MTLGSEGKRTDVSEGVSLTDTQILTVTLWGEGRGEPIEGRIAIGCVIRNRVLQQKRGQETYAKVCLAPWQFSCWRKEGGLSNYEATMGMARRLSAGDEINDPIIRECGWIAHGIIGHWLIDRVRAATHYYNPEAMVPKHRVPPWAFGKTPVCVIGDHRFFAKVA